MADPLSIAAAGAGFLSLAGQVLDGIVKLRGFIATVDSAPREIHDLCHELDIFRGLLEEAGRRVQESPPMGTDVSHLKNAFAHCEKMRGYAESMLKRLEANINKSKATAALRYPFKKTEIEGMLLGVERGKTSLLLANQSFESSLASRRHVELSAEQRKTNEEIAQVMSKTTSVADSHNQQLASIAHVVAASTQCSGAQTRDLKEAYTDGYRQICTTLSQLQDQSTSISSSVTGQAQQTQRIATSVFSAEHAINEVNARLEALTLQIASQTQIGTTTTTTTTLSFRLMPLSITLERTSSRKRRTLAKPKPTVRLLTVRLPKWFLHRQYDLQLLYATSGWPFTLNACSIVQNDSPFFEACREGDLETIKVLLSNKQASIYDRTPVGLTAFFYAIHNGQLEVCKFLRHAGIFAQFDRRDYHNSLYSLESYLDDFTEHNLELLRVAAPLNEPDRDWLREYCQTTTDDGTVLVSVDIKLLSLLNSLPSDTGMLSVSHLRSYFECRIRSDLNGGCHSSFVSYIARVLSNIPTVHEITTARDKHAWIVYGLASEIAHDYLGRYSQLDTNQWLQSVRQSLCAVVRTGLSPHQTPAELDSPWVKNKWYQDLNMTPLGVLCVEAMQERERDRVLTTQKEERQDANAKLQAWLSGLHSAGIDLLQYAESESACHGYCPDLLVIPSEADTRIAVVTGARPEDWHLSVWEPCESHARLFWRWVEGTPVVPGLTARILELYPVADYQDLTSPDLPGSWLSGEAHIAEKLESCFLGDTDDELAQIEEDLPLLSESDFFAKWRGLGLILSRPRQ